MLLPPKEALGLQRVPQRRTTACRSSGEHAINSLCAIFVAQNVPVLNHLSPSVPGTLVSELLFFGPCRWDDASSDVLAREALDVPLPPQEAAAADDSGGDSAPRRVALLSAPSVWYGLERVLAERGGKASVSLLEYDRRFEASAGPSYVFYDYNSPEAIPPELHRTFDYILAGPPYVALPCIDRYLEAFELLAKSPRTPRAIVIGATLEEGMAKRGYTLVEDVELAYRSKFCTPMRLYRKY